MSLVRYFFAFLSLVLSGVVCAAPSACPTHYVDGDAPEIANAKISAGVRELCFSAFGVFHSGVTRTPLWSAERLTRDSLASAKGLERVNVFHPELQLPANERAELRDYVRSGYDRGHMSPSANMPTEAAQHESFTLANMVPQNPENNRRLWADLESAVRNLAKSRGEIYTITGPLFLGDRLTRLNGRVLVPTHLFKVVFDPKRNEGAAYWAANNGDYSYDVISIAELERRAGIVFFPRVSSAVKNTAIALPEPKHRHR